MPAIDGDVRTLLIDPISGHEVVPVLSVPCISREEAIAEKLRAALCRRDVAIRDFYDLDHAVQRLGVRLDNAALVGLVRKKLAVPGNAAPDMSQARLDALRRQLNAELAPVLRPADFDRFDLERAFAAVLAVAAAVRSRFA